MFGCFGLPVGNRLLTMHQRARLLRFLLNEHMRCSVLVVLLETTALEARAVRSRCLPYNHYTPTWCALRRDVAPGLALADCDLCPRAVHIEVPMPPASRNVDIKLAFEQFDGLPGPECRRFRRNLIQCGGKADTRRRVATPWQTASCARMRERSCRAPASQACPASRCPACRSSQLVAQAWTHGARHVTHASRRARRGSSCI